MLPRATSSFTLADHLAMSRATQQLVILNA